MVNPKSITVESMSQTPQPDSLFTFEFDESGAVAGLTVADRWSQHLELEEFGYALLLAYAEQHALAGSGIATVDGSGNPDHVRYPKELQHDVVDLARDVSSVFEALATYTPQVSEPTTVSDRYRHVTIEVVNGMPGKIEVDEGWLRKADLGEVERDVVAAFQAVAAEAPKDELLGEISAMRERLAGIVARRNDYSKEY